MTDGPAGVRSALSVGPPYTNCTVHTIETCVKPGVSARTRASSVWTG